MSSFAQSWGCAAIIPALRRLRQDVEFEASLGYIGTHPVSKNQEKKRKMICFLTHSFGL
jgi:hypothetical protein